MATGTCEWQSDFARTYMGQGREEGLAQGKREALLRLPEAPSVSLGTDARRKIEACTDSDQLDSWITKAVTVTDADELFD